MEQKMDESKISFEELEEVASDIARRVLEGLPYSAELSKFDCNNFNCTDLFEPSKCTEYKCKQF